MKLYKNIMEDLVEEQFDHIKNSLDCCTCEQCRSDMIAYTLNHLPSRYVVSQAGEIISKVNSLKGQHMTDIRTELMRASQIVKNHPRH
ncbi:late competence development ComFB family protein [Luxibacter massiliensis]|uniref:late competence development ComFB family protein n=1 Tax=Luxibacter massiliensis TaxID=2219695 RepID=UPI000F058061|nr:late competence development ComFB family protein [Luxibacter massiliensis]